MHKVSLLLLNFVEISSQKEPLRVFPNFYEHLQKGKMDSLEQYLVKYCHTAVSPPTNKTETLLLEYMCLNRSKGMILQYGREYGLADKNEPAGAIQLNLLTAEKLAQLPTNNIPMKEFSQNLTKRQWQPNHATINSRQSQFKMT